MALRIEAKKLYFSMQIAQSKPIDISCAALALNYRWSRSAATTLNKSYVSFHTQPSDINPPR